MTKVRENTISMLVRNKPDVLARIAGTFSGRGFNIESISANITINPEVTRIIITTIGNKATVEKLMKQLDRLIDIMHVDDLTGKEAAKREMLLIRMNIKDDQKESLMKIVNTYNWRIVRLDNGYFTLEITGAKDDIDRALSLLEPLGIDDYSRTGTVALEKRKMI
jgi:acetolactate synthase I/III small subunit